jgi:hypothetical protein
MLHAYIESEEVIERYVRNRLTPEDKNAFEEHFFTCEDCFAKVQEIEQFVAGVDDAAERGMLPTVPEPAANPVFAGWMPWVLGASTLAAAALAAVVGWMALDTVPKLEADLNATSAKVSEQQQTIAELQQAAGSTAEGARGPEANVPLVMLESSRGGETATAVLPAGAKRLILWVEIGPTRFNSYRMEVVSQAGTPVATLDNLTRGPYGGIVASLPADHLQPGSFRITLKGQSPPPAGLVGDYLLQIRRR